MNVIQQGLTVLLRSAIAGEKLPLPEGFSLADAMEEIRKHSVITLAYAGGVNCGISTGDPAMAQLFRTYCRQMQQSEGQLRDFQRLCDAFDQAGIDYLPVKGSKMKYLYPRPELRIMGDADILIRQAQYESHIVPVMESLGFQFRKESGYELIWDSQWLHVELHKQLIPPQNVDFYAWFGNGWKLAHREAGCRYAMSPEDEFVYLLTHFARHYRDGGIGCRHVVDLWVYRRHFPALDEGRIRFALEQLGLLKFYENIRRLIAVWFEDGTGDELTEVIAQMIFASGNWGETEARLLATNARGIAKGRVRYALRLLFPEARKLYGLYPVLRKAPWLLPLFWLWRPFEKLLFQRRKVKYVMGNMRLITREKLDGQIQHLREVGLSDRY